MNRYVNYLQDDKKYEFEYKIIRFNSITHNCRNIPKKINN